MAETTEHKKAASDLRSEFEALPLDEKFSKLLQLEVVTLNEAMKYVADSSMKVLEKVGDAIGDLGIKIEAEAKKATAAPCEEKETEAAEPTKKAKPAPKRRPRTQKE